MKYTMMVRSRPRRNESIEESHRSFFSCLTADGTPWGFSGAVYPPPPEIGQELIAVVPLAKYLAKGIRGRLCYTYRGVLADQAKYDDFCLLEFDPTRSDYRALVEREFEKYIRCSNAYMGEIVDTRFADLDFESARKIDKRVGVYRIAPVCFFDSELCRRAFGLGPKEIADLLTENVEGIKLINNGILIVSSYRPLELHEADSANLRARRLLQGAHRSESQIVLGDN